MALYSSLFEVAGGFAKKSADDTAAGQISQEAGQSVASGIQASIEDRRRASYVASGARAKTAASGLTTTDTSAIKNVGDIRGQGEYEAQTALYQGYDRASELTYRANQLRNEGNNAVVSSVIDAGTSFYDKYAANELEARKNPNLNISPWDGMF